MQALNICLGHSQILQQDIYNGMFVPITIHVHCPLNLCLSFVRNATLFQTMLHLNNGAQKDACVGSNHTGGLYVVENMTSQHVQSLDSFSFIILTACNHKLASGFNINAQIQWPKVCGAQRRPDGMTQVPNVPCHN